jgi:hypothetical protein
MTCLIRISMHRTFRPALWLALAFACINSALGELPSVRFDRLAPIGAAAGTTVEVEVAGADIDDVKSLLFDHPGLRAEFVKDGRFRVSVAADVPAGTYDVRLVGRFGVSNPRLFAVSHGLKDVPETEPNNEPSSAQPIDVNSAVSGTSDGNGEDVFRFTAKQGQRITLTCQAGKLDSLLDANLSLTSATGQLLAGSSDYFGRDPFIDFVAPADGDYRVSIYDLSYRGGFPYRLLVSDRPHVENVFPRAVEAGKPVELQAFGRNLGPAARPSNWQLNGLALDETRIAMTPPADLLAVGAFRFLESPTDHTVLPTAATCTVTGYQWQPNLGGWPADAQTLVVTDTAITLEAEPNDAREQPQPIKLPAVVSGRFDRPRDADWFELEVPENGSYSFDVYCERIAGRGDPYLVVADDQGNRVAELDDYGHRINAFDGHLRDPAGTVNLSVGKKYRVLVQDRYSRGGARYQYVLSVRKPAPDFYVAVIHSQNPGPGGTTIWKGGAAYLDVIIHQRDGYGGPVTITAEGLPPGLHATPTTIAQNTRGTLVLWADENAPDWAGTIRLMAEGRRGDTVFRREVRPYTRVWNDPSLNSSRPTRELAVALRERAPYSLQFAQPLVDAKAGQKLELALKAKRLWPDFKDKIALQPLALPSSIQMANAEIAAASTETNVAITLGPGTPPGDYTLAVQAQAQVPFNKDPNAANRPNTLVTLPSEPITIRVVGSSP